MQCRSVTKYGVRSFRRDSPVQPLGTDITGDAIFYDPGSQVLGTCRTEHLSPFLISVRLNDRPFRAPDSVTEENKKIAYLIDLQAIRILDLVRYVSHPECEGNDVLKEQ